VRAANASKERITIGEETVRLARKNYDQAKGMYEEGLSDYLRVLDADARLVSAERSLLEVKRSGRARERALDALQAAVLLVKLKYLDEWLDHRRANADMYSRLLANLDGVCAPFVDASGTHSFNYYTIRVSKPRLDRNGLKRHLESKGVARQFITHCLFTSKRFTGIWGTVGSGRWLPASCRSGVAAVWILVPIRARAACNRSRSPPNMQFPRPYSS
jgi:hypothetical protein